MSPLGLSTTLNNIGKIIWLAQKNFLMAKRLWLPSCVPYLVLVMHHACTPLLSHIKHGERSGSSSYILLYRNPLLTPSLVHFLFWHISSCVHTSSCNNSNIDKVHWFITWFSSHHVYLTLLFVLGWLEVLDSLLSNALYYDPHGFLGLVQFI